MRIGFSNRKMSERREHIRAWWDEEFDNDGIDVEQWAVLQGFYDDSVEY